LVTTNDKRNILFEFLFVSFKRLRVCCEGDAAHSNQLLSTIISNALIFFPLPTVSAATKTTAEEMKKLVEGRYNAAVNPQESETLTSTLRVLNEILQQQQQQQQQFI
jgi:hypothetical protein